MAYLKIGIGLLLLVFLVGPVQASTNPNLSFNLDGTAKVLVKKPTTVEGIQVADHSPAEWRAYLKRKRAKQPFFDMRTAFAENAQKRHVFAFIEK